MPYLDSANMALPFQAESETSRAAAEAMVSASITQRQRLYAYYATKGQGGSTDEEAEVALDLRRSSICARRAELLKAGLVEAAPQTRTGSSGCRLQVWRVKENR